MTRIVVLGEALVDLVGEPGGRRFRADPGGSPANVAVGLARLGADATLLTRLGDDAFGRLVTDHVTASGAALDARPAAFTSLAIVPVDAAGVPSYDFALSWDPAPVRLPPDTAVLHTGSLAAAIVPDAVEAAMREAPVVTYDPNVRPAFARDRTAERERVERQVELSDVVKASDEDLAWLYPGTDPAEVARRWHDLGPALVVVTRGPRGCIAINEAGLIERPAPPVEVVDTVGAGDAFMSGLLSGLLAGGLLDPAKRTALLRAGETLLSAPLAKALAAAAYTCARPGADPPTTEALASSTAARS
ncbi:carbohydrate kinase [Actinomadura sp. LD22]|uniref:Carbohydrate kinase n=1 Tax=Actinomadura physcomitrii TaxID=2650748 RepID=A0A6I4M922_9ACTN|nr:carbohydrate kinase [Actinomadura physcomitrii]MWA02668.1 carbohydrate kinase [Actinomadura physcomitrii]